MKTIITTDQMASFVAAWYSALDFHAPAADCCKMLADEGLRMHFPDAEIHNLDAFRKWYEKVINTFFDEQHTVNKVQSKIMGDHAEVDVVVGWQASWREPKAPKSKRVSLDAIQKWIVRRSAKNAFGLEILSYNAEVESFKYAPGFARL